LAALVSTFGCSGSQLALLHGKHLAEHPLRLGALPFAMQGLAQIVRRAKPLYILLHGIPHSRPK
jgi:hypothetical protein